MPNFDDRETGNVGDAPTLTRSRPQTHGTRCGVQAGAFASRASHVRQVFDLRLRKSLLAAFLLVVLHRVIENLALVTAQLDACAHAIGAPAVLAVVREQARVQFGIRGGALRASPQGREHAVLADAGGGLATEHGFAQALQIAQHMHHTFAMFQGFAQSLAQRRFIRWQHIETGNGQLDAVLLEPIDARKALRGQKVTVDAQVGVAPRTSPVGQFGVNTFSVGDQWRQEANVLAAKAGHELRHDAVGCLRLHRGVVVHAVLDAQFHIQQAQEMPNLGGGAHGGFAATPGQALLDRHGRWNAVDSIHLGAPSGLHDGAGVGVQALQIPALAFVEQDVKGQRGFARTTDASDHVELAARNVHAQVFEVVFFGVDDLDVVVGHHFAGDGWRACHGFAGRHIRPCALLCTMHLTHGLGVFTQGLAGVRCGVLPHLFRRALGHDEAAGITAFRAQINQPVAGANHVQVVLDDDQRMSGFEQLAQGAHQFGNVVKVQARGGLIEQKQRAFARQLLAAAGGTFGGLCQKSRKLEALRFPARQSGHGLAELDVFQPDIHDGLQGADHIAVLRKQGSGFAHREGQHIGHVQVPRLRLAHSLALHRDLENLGAVALAIAIGAAQIHIGQKLHLHVLEARATAGGATAITAVEAEFAGGVTTLARQRRGRKNLAHRIPGPHIAGRIGARRFANG